jgi:heme/copper-type cytochrome/quinol oxidase subunit 2
MLYSLFIFIFAILSLSLNTTIRIGSIFALAALPTFTIFRNDADMLLKVPFVLLLVITLMAYLMFTMKRKKRSVQAINMSDVLNKGAWLFSILISTVIIFLVLYDNEAVFNQIIEYSELVKKPNYLHLDTLIQYSPLAIFSLVGVLMIRAGVEEK